MKVGSPPTTGVMTNGGGGGGGVGVVVQVASGQQQQQLSSAPLTPPAHELEQPHPIYGQPHIQVQHGVLVKAPPGSAIPHLTTLSHPGTPPDTPPVSASPPPMPQMYRGSVEREFRDRGGLLLHLQQPPPGMMPSDAEMQPINGSMGWISQTLREQPLDLRPHCPPDQTPEPHPDHWTNHGNPHHFQEVQHQQQQQLRSRHGGKELFLITFVVIILETQLS